MSGIEGVEREDYDDGEAGVGAGRLRHLPLRARRKSWVSRFISFLISEGKAFNRRARRGTPAEFAEKI
jgi:hypothetical protein